MLSTELASLVEILEAQSRLYQELLSLAKEKQPVLVKGDLAKLEELTKREREIVFQVGRLEEQRFKVQQALANHFGVPATELTISLILEKFEEPLKGRVSIIAQEFSVILDELKNHNELNTQLVEQSLSYIDFMVNILTAVDEPPTYQGQETGNTQQSARLFDKKI